MAMAETALGVPEITPVRPFKTSPAGSAGDTENPLTTPEIVGLNEAMAVPTVNVFGEL